MFPSPKKGQPPIVLDHGGPDDPRRLTFGTVFEMSFTTIEAETVELRARFTPLIEFQVEHSLREQARKARLAAVEERKKGGDETAVADANDITPPPTVFRMINAEGRHLKPAKKTAVSRKDAQLEQMAQYEALLRRYHEQYEVILVKEKKQEEEAAAASAQAGEEKKEEVITEGEAVAPGTSQDPDPVHQEGAAAAATIVTPQ